MKRIRLNPGPLVLTAVLFEGSLVLAALALAWLLDVPLLDGISWTWESFGWGVAATAPPLACMWWCTRSRWRPCRSLTRVVRRMIVPLLAACTPLDLLMIAAMAGLGEELLFRGVVQVAVEELLGAAAGVLAGSLLFALAHPMTMGYIVFAGLLGIYLGTVYWATDSLMTVVYVHALYDFVTLAYLVRSNGNLKPSKSEG